MDRDRLLVTLEGYGEGPRLCGLLETFWDFQQVVPRQNSLTGPVLPATRVTTQGRRISLTLFNVVVDNVIKTWLAMTIKDQRVPHDGLGETIGRCLGVLYSDNSMVSSRDSACLKHTMNVLVGLVRRYGLAANVSKSRTMTCHTGISRAGMLEEAMPLKCAGVGDLYRVRLRRADTMPVVWSWDHRGFHDGTPSPHSRDGARNQLESAAGQTDGSPTPGTRCELLEVEKAMSLPLPLLQLPGFLPLVELLALARQQAELGG